MNRRPVLGAGGGIGGWSVALTLHQIGVPCLVLESAVAPAVERDSCMSRYTAAAGFAMETISSMPPIIAPDARVRQD